MTVHILGCGPAGLAAAHAAVMAGHEVRIFSKKRKSTLYGAQYLHAPIPYIRSGDPVTVTYRIMGTPIQYRSKVYGAAYDGTVSPEDLPEEHQAWDIRKTYARLWARYSELVEATPNINSRWMHMNKHLRPMISSIPQPQICFHPNLCVFRSITIWAAGEAPDRGRMFTKSQIGVSLADNEVICNGLAAPQWYRGSRIFGHATLEWPWPAGPNALAPSAVPKPISNNCQCWPDVLRVGRYGRWEKGVLVHHAYEETDKWLQSLP